MTIEERLAIAAELLRQVEPYLDTSEGSIRSAYEIRLRENISAFLDGEFAMILRRSRKEVYGQPKQETESRRRPVHTVS